MCLGHHLTFHGDPHDGHKFHTYPTSHSIDKMGHWDYYDEVHNICSHHEVLTPGRKYKCLGHSEGDHLYPTFHGDPARGRKFWVYPKDRKLVTHLWDFRTPNVCNNHVAGPIDKHGIQEF